MRLRSWLLLTSARGGQQVLAAGWCWQRLLHQGKPTELYIADNSGLVIAYSFKAGIDHVSANPTGVEIGRGPSGCHV